MWAAKSAGARLSRERFAGSRPSSVIALACGEHVPARRGGGHRNRARRRAVYALSQPLREQLAQTGAAVLVADLAPILWALAEIAAKLARAEVSKRRDTLSNRPCGKALALDPVAIGLFAREAHGVPICRAAGSARCGDQGWRRVKVRGLRPMDRAISSAGGVAFSEIDDAFMLKSGVRASLVARRDAGFWERRRRAGNSCSKGLLRQGNRRVAAGGGESRPGSGSARKRMKVAEDAWRAGGLPRYKRRTIYTLIPKKNGSPMAIRAHPSRSSSPRRDQAQPEPGAINAVFEEAACASSRRSASS